MKRREKDQKEPKEKDKSSVHVSQKHKCLQIMDNTNQNEIEMLKNN